MLNPEVALAPSVNEVEENTQQEEESSLNERQILSLPDFEEASPAE